MKVTPGREIFNMSFCKEQTKFQRKLKELYLGKSARKRSVNITKTQNKMKQRMVLNFRSIFKRNNRVEKLSNKRHLELSKSFRNKTKTFSSDKRILMIQKAITHERQSPKNLSSTKRYSLLYHTYLNSLIFSVASPNRLELKLPGTPSINSRNTFDQGSLDFQPQRVRFINKIDTSSTFNLLNSPGLHHLENPRLRNSTLYSLNGKAVQFEKVPEPHESKF